MRLQPLTACLLFVLSWAFSFLLGSILAAADPAPHNPICPMLETTARSNKLPLAFFARLIWQESHFHHDVVGPITRSGKRAQGIAQFMPGTAAEVGLADPFNPEEAIPKSGALLASLRNEFGNLGLAAAAYNAGPQRVREFLTGIRAMPPETRQYVLAITGHPVDDWTKPKQESASIVPTGAHSAQLTCDSLLATLKEEAARQAALQRNVPSWCRFLHDPNQSVCGSVHARGQLGASLRINRRLRANVAKALLR